MHERLLIAGFTVLRIFKGDKSVTQLQTPADSASCGVVLKPGSRYLIYAYGPEDNGRISTNLCMRTALVEQATQDIEVLDAATRPVSVASQPTAPERRFYEALEWIHSHPDDDDTMTRAIAIADQLAKSDPLSGLSQALRAEIFSIWLLAYDGEPVEQQNTALALIDEALRINPKLAQAHVARARIYASASKRTEAEAEIQAALRIQPQLPSAFFVQAEIYRRANNSSKATDWIWNYIEVVKQPVLKANGHQWYGDMYRDIAYHPEAVNREVSLLIARAAYQKSINLDPSDVRRLVNFSAFLNDLPADMQQPRSTLPRLWRWKKTPLLATTLRPHAIKRFKSMATHWIYRRFGKRLRRLKLLPESRYTKQCSSGAFVKSFTCACPVSRFGLNHLLVSWVVVPTSNNGNLR